MKKIVILMTMIMMVYMIPSTMLADSKNSDTSKSIVEVLTYHSNSWHRFTGFAVKNNNETYLVSTSHGFYKSNSDKDMIVSTCKYRFTNDDKYVYYDGTVKSVDRAHDIAIISISQDVDINPLVISTSTIAKDDVCHTIGSSKKDAWKQVNMKFDITSTGFKNGAFNHVKLLQFTSDAIKTDSRNTCGLSGAPILNSNNEVVGVQGYSTKWNMLGIPVSYVESLIK